MSTKISKFLLVLILIIMTISSYSVCLATEAVTTSETETVQEETSESTQEEIHSGDLYIFDTDVLMDKLVDGNVFIFGTNVEVTGQVNGNLFVVANNVKFDESYVRYSIFACANSVYYNGACNDLYVATTDLEMTYDSYVVRDLKALSSNTLLKAAIGRDVDLISNTVNFGEEGSLPIVYGNLRYSANNEVEIPEEVISDNGEITYTKLNNLSSNSIADILLTFLTFIVTVIVLSVIITKFAPNFIQKLSAKKLSALRLLKAFGIGILTIISFAILFVILLFTKVGTDLALILLTLFVFACLISIPALVITITNIFKQALKIEKITMSYLILVLVCIVIQDLALIPVAGEILIFIISVTALGLLVDTYLPQKELTPEEIAAKAEAKRLAKEEKERKKQEKLEAKKK